MSSKPIPGLPDDLSKKILEIFQSNSQISEVILFGSRAKGAFREGSDIDIAIKGSNLTFESKDAILLLYDKLFLPWKLDIVLYESIQEPELKAHIDRAGQALFSR